MHRGFQILSSYILFISYTLTARVVKQKAKRNLQNFKISLNISGFRLFTFIVCESSFPLQNF